MRAFVQNSQIGVKISAGKCMVSETKILIAFSIGSMAGVAFDIQGGSGDVFWIMGSTSGSNIEDLVLIAVGPAAVGVVLRKRPKHPRHVVECQLDMTGRQS